MTGMKATFEIDTVRIFLHVLGVTVWVGGQLVMLSLLPVLRSAGIEDLPARAAQAFQRVAWPAFGLAVITGVWNIFEVDLDTATSGYNAAFGIKFLLVIISGLAAYIHAQSDKRAIKGMMGGIGFLSALGAMFLGFAMAH
jgi:putative copper export protein